MFYIRLAVLLVVIFQISNSLFQQEPQHWLKCSDVLQCVTNNVPCQWNSDFGSWCKCLFVAIATPISEWHFEFHIINIISTTKFCWFVYYFFITPILVLVLYKSPDMFALWIFLFKKMFRFHSKCRWCFYVNWHFNWIFQQKF